MSDQDKKPIFKFNNSDEDKKERMVASTQLLNQRIREIMKDRANATDYNDQSKTKSTSSSSAKGNSKYGFIA